MERNMAGLIARELAKALQDQLVRVAEVVNNHDLETGLHERQRGVRADVAGPTGDEHCVRHLYTKERNLFPQLVRANSPNASELTRVLKSTRLTLNLREYLGECAR